MPQTYRRQYSDYPPPTRISLEPRRRTSMAFPEPQITNADDSIVLSDIIRTGEQSRLRRRGAMRLEHPAASVPRTPSMPVPVPASASAPPPSRAPASAFTRPATPPWAIPYRSAEEDYNGDPWNWMVGDEDGISGPVTSISEEQRRSEADDAEEGFILHCGGEVSGLQSDGVQCLQAFEPTPLPWNSRKPSSSTRHPPARKTNGCGAVVHVRAFPQKPRGVWVGKEEATEVVVGMDQAYFERTVITRMMKSACGCVREGVGCAVCGNPLGTRYMPCQAASEGLFSTSSHPTARSVRPLHPAGPSYWQAHRPTSSITPSRPASRTGTPRPAQSSFYVYTFFANQVSSSPPCSFPPAPKVPERRHEIPPYPVSPEPARPVGASSGATWLGYSPSSSPLPYSPSFAPPPSQPSRERSTSPTLRLPRGNPPLSLAIPTPGMGPIPPRFNRLEEGPLDADGVLIADGDIPTEPNSPDKVGSEGLLWSGR